MAKKSRRPSSPRDQIQSQQMSLEQALNVGVQLHKAGRLDEAESVYRQILTAAPREHNAICFLGSIAHQRGRHEAAVELLEQSLTIYEKNPTALNNLGAAKLALGDANAAIKHFKATLKLQPDYLDAELNLGNALLTAGEPAQALTAFQSAIKKHSEFARAHLGAGNAAHALHQFSTAVAHYRKAIRYDSTLHNARRGLTLSLIKAREPNKAIKECDEAIAVQPFSKEFHLLKANALEMLGDEIEATKCYEKALAIDPDDFAALNNLGNKYKSSAFPKKAIEYYSRAIAIDPSRTKTYGNLASALIRVGDIDEGIAHLERVIEAEPDYLPSYTALLFALNHKPQTSPKTLFECAAAFGAMVAKQIPQRAPQRNPGSAPPLRIGFVSGDFRRHPVAYFLLSLFDAFDSKKVTLIAYSNNKDEDDLTARLRKSVDIWRPVKEIDDEELAQRIVDDKIDILVDLSGHTTGTRLPVFARKPAPIQITWLGYSGATGLRAMDYVLCDPWEIPEEEAQYFTEEPWRLPNTRHCYTPPEEDVDTGTPPAQKNGYLTYGVFQRHSKVNADFIDCLVQIANRTPFSRIAFRGNGFDEGEVKREVLDSFKTRGGDAERIVFLKRTSRQDFFGNYNKVDIALSPFPWPGITTTCEALWMGVPSVFLKGDRFLGRIGESITRNLDMTDWMGDDIDDYVRIAVEKASDLEALAALRAGLRERFLSSPLCDANLFARNLENAFEEMVRRYHEQQGAGD